MIRRNQEGFDRLVKQLKDGKFEYRPKEDKLIDWSKYDRAQINEINDMLIMIRDSVDAAVGRLNQAEQVKKGPGRPPNAAVDLAKVLLMQQYFGVSNRVAEGLVLLFEEKLHLRSTFSYKTIERAYEYDQVIRVLDVVFRLTQEPVSDKEHNFSPDGTGLSMSTKQNWETDKADTEKHKGFEKMIGMIGYEYKLFSAVVITETPYDNESPYLEPLLNQTQEAYERIDLVAADAAYPSRHNCDLISQAGAVPRIYPKEGLTIKRDGSGAWAQMFQDLIDDPQKWLREYHRRSISETGNSTLKRDYPLL